MNIFVFSIPVSNLSANTEGFKHYRNYPPSEYVYQHSQNWAFQQDRRGILYVANQATLLQYDGLKWTAVDIPNDTARSLAVDHNGTIFVGGNNEIGFLKPNDKGTQKYHSLVNRLEKKHRNFSWVFSTYCNKQGAFFRSAKYIFHWNYRDINVWETPDRFDGAFSCLGTIFVHGKKTGLMQIKNGSLSPTPGGQALKGKKIALIVEHGKKPGNLLVGTRLNGFYTYDGKTFNPFPTGMDEYLKKNQLYHGIALNVSPGHLALTTKKGGLVIMDDEGNAKGIYNTSMGLLSDNIKNVYEDVQGNLWLATENGIAKIEYSSPLTIYNDRLNLKGLVLAVTKHENQMVAGTSWGVFYLDPGTGFRQVPGINGMCYALLSRGKSLLTAANAGVLAVENREARQKLLDIPSYALMPSTAAPHRVWAGTERGLFALTTSPDGNEWKIERRFDNINVPIKTIAEDHKGNLWLGTQTRTLIKVDFPIKGRIENHSITTYAGDKLPFSKARVYWADGHVIFATDKGIYRFDSQKKKPVPDNTLGKEFMGGNIEVFLIKEAPNRRIWFHSQGLNYSAQPLPGGTFQTVPLDFPGLPRKQVNCIFAPDNGGPVWFAGDAGLIVYDTHNKKTSPFNLLIRRVEVNDRLVLNNFDELGKKSAGSGSNPLEIPYDQRNIKFEYAAPFFTDESALRYRYFLQGSDSHWSKWSASGTRDYIGLEPGDYRFRVKAKNTYGHESGERAFHFTILPPWYRSWWAYSLAGFLFFLLLFSGMRMRLAKLQRDKRKLQKLIDNATVEIRDKNRLLEKQAGDLREMAAVRTRFFANISHEFRTPLTLIMGPLEQMMSQNRDQRQLKRLGMMRRNSQRLLTLINQLLALSRIDKGAMKLKACQQNIVPFLKGILASFQLAADHRKLTVAFEAQSDDIPVYFDPEKLEDVFCNLLLNLINLTPAREAIQVDVSADGFLQVSVNVSGLDIPGHQMEHMFDRFYLAEESYEHRPKGYGIGLALAKELVTLHHGELAAQKTENQKGTLFIIRLPLGKNHLTPEEIAEPSMLPGNFTKSPDIPVPPLPQDDTGEPDTGQESEAKSEEKSEEKSVEKSEEKSEEKIIILLVEDNADTRDFVTEALEPFYTVIEAENGREGIKKAKESIPDLIISDIIMPYADGYKVCRELKKDVRTSHIPIILLTAKSGEESILKGLETGADDYITKPFNMKLLHARIKNLIDLRKQWQMKVGRQMVLQPVDVSVSPIDENFIKELQDMIEKNLPDPDFGVEELAGKLYMSRATLYRKIRALTGESPHRFIRSYRLKRSAQLFKAGFGNVSEVAMEVGFNNISYFSQCFKEKFHLLPTEYQASESHVNKGKHSA